MDSFSTATMVAVFTALPPAQQPGLSHPDNASSTQPVVPEQEDIWESDIYPPSAWGDEAAATSRPDRSSIACKGPSTRPATRLRRQPSLDAGGEVWEDDLYDPEAWIHGVDLADLPSCHPSASGSSATATGAGRTAVPPTHEEVFWPNIEAYISDPRGSRPTVTCVICRTSRLVIAGLQEPTRESAAQVRGHPRTQSGAAEEADGLEYEAREVLPCGHVVGEQCFSEWEAVAAKPVKCPVCNAVVD